MQRFKPQLAETCDFAAYKVHASEGGFKPVQDFPPSQCHIYVKRNLPYLLVCLSSVGLVTLLQR